MFNHFLEDFNEELLALHDAEVQRLKQHYEDHRELFEGVNKWEESWRLFLELEVKSLFSSFDLYVWLLTIQ